MRDPIRGLAHRRDADVVQSLAKQIHARTQRRWRIMEVCGGQTHSIVRYGIDDLLPDSIDLVHGPGCPVCVTPVRQIDLAQRLACTPGVVVCSFGDMLRVPGTRGDFHRARARGGRVRVVYSPLDALDYAHAHPEVQVVFFAVGFETTAPATALCLARARMARIENFSVLVAHVRVPPVLEALLGSPGCSIDGLLAAGHVCSVMGLKEYAPLCSRYRVPIVATGFEPVDLLEGILSCVSQLESGRAEVENQYQRAVQRAGNRDALELLESVFEPVDREWRGLGQIQQGGMRLRPAFARFDAERRFGVSANGDPAYDDAGPYDAESTHAESLPDVSTACWSDRVLRGEVKPDRCPHFATRCRPEAPLGAPMVSDEGACAAYFRYRGARTGGASV